MTRRHRKFKRGSRCFAPGMLAAALAALMGGALANGYPPPPGPYHIDSGLFDDSAPLPAAKPNEQAPPPFARPIAPHILPPPHDGTERKPGSYDATNLFGSPRTTPDRNDPKPHTEDDKGSTGLAPAIFPAPYPAQDGSSMAFRPATPAQAPAGGFHQPQAPYQQGYSQYAPGYPNHPQYHGPMTGYGPAPAGPGYPTFRGQIAPAHPQPTPTGRFRTTAPTQGDYPASAPNTRGQAPEGYFESRHSQPAFPVAAGPTGQVELHEPKVAEPVFYPGIEHIRQAPESGTFSPVGNAPPANDGSDAFFRPAKPLR